MEPLFQATLGPAGTGKSYRINERLKGDSTYCLRTATTGIAAVNMSVVPGGGSACTINSALAYKDTVSLLYLVASKQIQARLAKIAKHFKYIVVDEVSMMEAGQVDLIYKAVNYFNIGQEKMGSRPLGLILTGDSGQLPAVGGSPFFDAVYWKEFQVTYLTEVKRQQDKEFIEALHKVRKGRAKEVVDWFYDNISFDKHVDPDFPGSTFFSKNSEVDEYNYKALASLPGKARQYEATVVGTPSSAWKDIPKYVELKEGALVTILVNNLAYGYANGDIAFVEQMFETKILVRLLRTGRSLYIEYNKLKNIPIGGFKQIGTISYMPLRLAWATTLHRCQGLTLDTAQFKLGGSFLPKLSGGLYTGLSRVRTKQGLRLVGNKDSFIESCFVDERYLKYIK